MATVNTRRRHFLMNFDSLVDIVSNFNGILILFAVITALIVLTKAFIIQTSGPKSTVAVVTEKNRVSFECRNNRVFPVYEDELNIAPVKNAFWKKNDAYYEDFLSKYRWELNYNWDGSPLVIKKIERRVKTHPKSYYKYIDLELEVDLALNENGRRTLYLFYRYELKPKSDDQGETMEEALQPRSVFLTEMDKIDPGNDFVYFFVHTDSYPVFRTLRKELINKKIDFGWKPLKLDESVMFGSHGDKSRIQR